MQCNKKNFYSNLPVLTDLITSIVTSSLTSCPAMESLWEGKNGQLWTARGLITNRRPHLLLVYGAPTPLLPLHRTEYSIGCHIQHSFAQETLLNKSFTHWYNRKHYRLPLTQCCPTSGLRVVSLQVAKFAQLVKKLSKRQNFLNIWQ